MKNRKSIVIIMICFLLFASINTAYAGIVADNNNYYSNYGYSITKQNLDTSISLKEVSKKDSINVNNTNNLNDTSSNNTTIITNQNTNISVANSDSGTSITYINPYKNYSYTNNSYIIPKSSLISTSNSIPLNHNINNDTTSSNENISQNEKILLRLINEDRQKRGLKVLQIDEKLFEIAQTKSQDMYDNNYFSHTSPIFGKTSSLIRNEGIRYYSYGENIGRTYSVYRAHNGFMNSDGHRANILNPKFTHIGIGIVENYYTEVFIQKY